MLRLLCITSMNALPVTHVRVTVGVLWLVGVLNLTASPGQAIIVE